jgi:hypothetical protein
MLEALGGDNPQVVEAAVARLRSAIGAKELIATAVNVATDWRWTSCPTTPGCRTDYAVVSSRDSKPLGFRMIGVHVRSGRKPDVARRRRWSRRRALWCRGAAVSTPGLRSGGRSLRLFCLRWRFCGRWRFLGRRLDLLLSLRRLLNMSRRWRWLLRGRRQLLWRRRGCRRNRQRLRRRDFSGGERFGLRGQHDHDAARTGRMIGRDRGDLASVVRAVGLHGCDDELVDGSGNSVGGIQPRERIFVVTVVSDQIHQIAHRHAAVEFGTRFMRRFDEAVRVVDWGNLFLAEEIEELLVLAWVGRGWVAGQNCRRDE